MLKQKELKKPVRCYLEEVGYNYIHSPGKILYPQEWFLSATEFNDDGYAIVESFSRKKMKIDTNGNLCDIIA